MLLALDIGNTNITLGAFRGCELLTTGRLTTDTRRMSDEYGMLISQLLPSRGVSASDITSVALCSVVPPLTPIFVEMCKRYLDLTPLVIGTGTRTGIRIQYDPPRDVGSDRIVDAAAAFNLHGGPVIVVDFGTATVFDAINAQGHYLGGALAPGLTVAAEALFLNTSQLRRIEMEKPPYAIGRNTIHAMQSGLILGYAEMVKGMVTRFHKELGEDAKVIGTGGLAEIIAKEADVFDAIDPNLTLIGLQIIHDLNS